MGMTPVVLGQIVPYMSWPVALFQIGLYKDLYSVVGALH